MTSRARHARISRPARQVRADRAARRLARAWYRARAAVRYCSPDTARSVGWRVFLIAESAVIAAWATGLLDRDLARAAVLSGAAGFMGLLLSIDSHIRRQQRLWSQAGARRLLLAPAEPVMPDDMRLRRNEVRLDAVMEAMHRVCEKADVEFGGDGTGWTPVVIEGGRNDPAA